MTHALDLLGLGKSKKYSFHVTVLHLVSAESVIFANNSFGKAERLTPKAQHLAPHLRDLLRRNPNRPIQWDPRTGQDRGEQVALIALGVRQEAAGLKGAAAFSREDERKVLARMGVAVFQAG